MISLGFFELVEVVLDRDYIEVLDDVANQILQVLVNETGNRNQPPELCQVFVFMLQS